MDSISRRASPPSSPPATSSSPVLVDYAPDDEYPPDVVELVQAATVFDEWIAQRAGRSTPTSRWRTGRAGSTAVGHRIRRRGNGIHDAGVVHDIR